LQAAAVIAAAIVVNLGAPLGLLIATSSVPWVLEGVRRRSGTVALALILLTWLMVMLVSTMATGAFDIPMLLGFTLAASVVGLAGLALSRGRLPLAIPRDSAIVWAGAAVGGVAWTATIAAASVIPGGARYAWVMLGDSANNVLFGREAIYRNGLAIGPEENPVPLPSAVLALGMAPGRWFVDPQGLLRHDIAVFALTWGSLIALSCVAVGVLAATVTRLSGASPTLNALVAAAASLLPLSWFVTGYPIEFGFYNTHLAILIMAAAMVAFLDADRRPAIAFAAQAVAATLMLAVWSPLVLMPGLLALVILLRSTRRLLATRGWEAALLIMAVTQLVVYGLVIVFPGFLALSGFLLAPGGIFGFPRPMLFGFAILTIIAAVAAFWRRVSLAWAGALAMAAASVIGLGFLLFVTRNQENPWSYYPLKFSWLAAVVLLSLLCGLLPALVIRITRGRSRTLRAVGLLGVASAIAGFLVVAPTFNEGYPARNPAWRLVSGNALGDGDQVAERIFSLSDPDQSALLWRTNDPFEASINFWVLQMWADSLDDNFDLRFAAYGNYDDDDPAELCRIVALMGGGTKVYTADKELLAQGARDTCPGAEIFLLDSEAPSSLTQNEQ
jgi:hypothetical protein